MKITWHGAFHVQRIVIRLAACLCMAMLLSPFAAPSAQAAGASPEDEGAPAAAATRLPATEPASFTVFAPLVQMPATSSYLIAEAVQRGEISEETGLVYQVFAAFGDERLPARYQGDDSQVLDSMIMAEVDQRFEGLSVETQATLAPFRLSPAEPGSWLELREGGAQAGAQSNDEGAEPAALTFRRITAANDRAWVWYLTALPDDEPKARAMAAELTHRIWPVLTAKMGRREPLPDAGLPDGGVDGRLDIYLVPLGDDAGQAPAIPPGCKGTPSFIYLKRSLDTTQMKAALAHEFMHVLTWTYWPNAHCVFPGEYAWLTEATGTWAEEVVYHDLNMAAEWRRAPFFLMLPRLPLEKDPAPPRRWYGAYLWLFYLDKTNNPASRIWTASAGATDSLDAVNRSIEGGFAEQWSKFTLRNWNKPPVDDYNTWDPGLTYTVSQFANAVEKRDITLAGMPDFAFNLDLNNGVEHLSAHYFHLKFPDENVRTAVFYNGFSYKLGMKDVTTNGLPYGVQRVASTLSDADRKGRNVRALVKISGQPWKEEDWTNRAFVSYCRDKTDERVEEIVLVFSNSDHSDRTRKLQPLDLPPTLWASNMACWKWTGTAKYRVTHPNGVIDTADATITWSRPAAGEATAVDNDIALRATGFEVQGTVAWTVSGYNTTNGCQYSGSGTTGIRGSLTLYNFTTEGERHRGYHGDAKMDVHEVQVNRTCSDGSGGPSPYPILVPVFTTWTPIGDHWAVKTIDAGGAKMKDEFRNFMGINAVIDWDFQAQRE